MSSNLTTQWHFKRERKISYESKQNKERKNNLKTTKRNAITNLVKILNVFVNEKSAKTKWYSSKDILSVYVLDAMSSMLTYVKFRFSRKYFCLLFKYFSVENLLMFVVWWACNILANSYTGHTIDVQGMQWLKLFQLLLFVVYRLSSPSLLFLHRNPKIDKQIKLKRTVNDSHDSMFLWKVLQAQVTYFL